MKKGKWKLTLIETEPFEDRNLIIPLQADRQTRPYIDKADPRIKKVQDVKGWGLNTCVIEIEPHFYALAR